jgi:putative membrane protein
MIDRTGSPGDRAGARAAGLEETPVLDWIIRVLINAAGVYVATIVVPQVSFEVGDDWWKLLGVALILALVNSYIRPIVKLLAFPITFVTLGLVAFVINGAMLLLVALVSDQLSLGFRIGHFPPDLDADAVIGAVIASVVISLVSAGLGILNKGRKLFG